MLQIIREGVANRASDLHFVPVLDGMAVSGRIDGTLREIKRFPVSQRDGVTARIKTLAEVQRVLAAAELG